jgi:hypothetical protein
MLGLASDRRARSGVLAFVTLLAFIVGAVFVPATARADVSVRLSGPAEYKSWLSEDGKVGAVVSARIKDPKSRVTTVKWCLDFGGGRAQCKGGSPRELGWKATGGWQGRVTLTGVRLTIQSCEQVDRTRPKVALVMRAFNAQGQVIGKGRHVMTETCNS